MGLQFVMRVQHYPGAPVIQLLALFIVTAGFIAELAVRFKTKNS